jgi:hypothetical protein
MTYSARFRRAVRIARGPAVALAALALLLWGNEGVGAAEARRRLEVRVVEVAGGRAYLAPGAEQQIRVGDAVQLGRGKYVVVAINREHAVVAVAESRPLPGQRGFVLVRSQDAGVVQKLAAPRPLQSFAGKWRAPSVPAESQSVRVVPLGPVNDGRRNRAALLLDYQRIQPLSGAAYGIGRARLRAQLHAESQTLPLRLDADSFLEFWQAQDLAERPQNASRPLLNVQQLEAGYRGDVLQGALGRLRHASRTTGMLDGARVAATPSEGWTLGAFGGTLPNPQDGTPSTDASRFGAEVVWQDDASAARPRASVTLQGSRYLGRMDERRVTSLFELYPELGRFGAHAEVSFFDADNPWSAAPTELTAAGADASFQFGSLRLSALLDARSPERSLWLAAFLPPEYFCVVQPVPGATSGEPCLGGDRHYAAALDAAWEAPLWALEAGVNFATTRPEAPAQNGTAFVSFRQREILELLRFDVGASASRGSLLESTALDVGLGMTSANDAADASLYYRPSLMRYRAGSEEFVEHGVGSRLWWAPSEVIDLTGSVDLLTGRDVDVLILQLGAAWHPRF